jgi:autotransporter translocation and assembly factor TamB
MMRKSILLITFAVTTVIVGIAFLFLLNSQTGSCWLVKSAISRFVKGAELKMVSGRLFSGMSIKHMSYQGYGLSFEFENIVFKLNPRNLVVGRIKVEDLDIETIHLSKADAGEPTDPMKAKAGGSTPLPSALVLENASIQRLWIQVNGSQRLLSQLHFSAQVDNHRFKLSHLDVTDQVIQIVTRGSLGLQQPYPINGELSWHFSDQDAPSMRGQVWFEGNPHTLNVEHRLYEPHHFETSGQVTFMAITDEQLSKDLNASLNTGCEVAPGILQLLLESLRGCQINFKGQVVGQQFPPMGVQIRSVADLCGIRLDEVAANALGGVAHAHGRIDLGINPCWRLKVDAINLDPGKYWAGWSGRIGLKADAKGQLKLGQPVLQIPALKLEGEMLGQPFLAEGAIALQEKQLSIDNLNIRSGDSWFKMGGAIGSEMNVSFQCEAKDPNHIWPGLTGKFVAAGSIRGPSGNLSTSFNLTGSEVSYYTQYYGKYKLRSLNAVFNSDLGNNINTKGSIRIEQLNIGDFYPVRLFDIKWNGNLNHHSTSVYFTLSPVSGSATLEDVYDSANETMKIHLRALQLDFNKKDKWQLDDSTDIVLSHFEVKPFSGCLKQNEHSACIQGHWDNESGWKMSGDLNNEPIPFLGHLLESLRKEIPLFQMKKAE